YSNPAFDDLVMQSRTTVDQEERAKLLNQANKLMLDENAVVVMYHGVVTSALDNKYTGLELDSTGKWSLKNVTGK
ncbi:MAG: glutathione ABC transporter substrate-binding protein, partial [Psychrobacillus sp.]